MPPANTKRAAVQPATMCVLCTRIRMPKQAPHPLPLPCITNPSPASPHIIFCAVHMLAQHLSLLACGQTRHAAPRVRRGDERAAGRGERKRRVRGDEPSNAVRRDPRAFELRGRHRVWKARAHQHERPLLHGAGPAAERGQTGAMRRLQRGEGDVRQLLRLRTRHSLSR